MRLHVLVRRPSIVNFGEINNYFQRVMCVWGILMLIKLHCGIAEYR
jgi:hypothetical protein